MSVGIGIGFGQGHVTLGDSKANGELSPTWSLRCWDTLDQVDHLILLPERALTMDSGWLEADLAEILAHSVISGTKGMTEVVGCIPLLTRSNTITRSVGGDKSDSWSTGRRRSLDWSLVNPNNQSPIVAITTSVSTSPAVAGGAAAAAAAALAASKEERSKMLRERQNEERQRKLEELKQHALATQKFREQQEEERRRRLEEQRQRDVERRVQVEERKKAILEAERERREAMLRRSEDRGMRQELKRRNERSAIAFAFGSSTPRMLEPAETVSSAYWGSRRATSTTNVMSASSHGRVTTNDAASVSSNGLGVSSASYKRASSVFGLDQNQVTAVDRMTRSVREALEWEAGDRVERRRSAAGAPASSQLAGFGAAGGPDTQPAMIHQRQQHQQHQQQWSVGRPYHGSLFGAGCVILGEDLMTQSMSAVAGGRRRRTDLIPTLPMHRSDLDRSPRTHISSSRGSVSRSTGLRSGDVTPSSPTRPLSALSHVSSASTTVATSMASQVHFRARTAPAGGRKPRPSSIAGTGVSHLDAVRLSHASRESINRDASHHVPTPIAQQRTSRSKEAKDKENEAKSRPSSAQPARARSADMRNKEQEKTPPTGKPATEAKRNKGAKQVKASEPVKNAKPITKDVKQKITKTEDAKPTEENDSEKSDVQAPVDVPLVRIDTREEVSEVDEATQETPSAELQVEEDKLDSIDSSDSSDSSRTEEAQLPEVAPAVETVTSGSTTPSEGSVSGEAPAAPPTGRKIISSEEEAKAALAEKRRLAREQMEREAERERQRLEEERRREEERLRQEELEQRLAEEEMNRLAQEARKAEEERLQKAIEETKRREEEERMKREEEARARAEKEAQEKKAREDAERLRKENEERLRREEEERQERRKRVEAIMARTRGKTSGATKSSTNELNSSGPSSTDLTNVGMSNSISQPDLLGDLVNKTNGVGSSNSSGNLQSLASEPDGKKNGFHQDSNEDAANGSSDLPDVSNVIDAPVASHNNNNNNVNEEHLALLS